MLLGLFVILSRPLFSKKQKKLESEEIQPEGSVPVDAAFEEVEEVEEETLVPPEVGEQPLPEE